MSEFSPASIGIKTGPRLNILHLSDGRPSTRFPLTLDTVESTLRLIALAQAASFSGVRAALRTSDHPWQLVLPNGNVDTNGYGYGSPYGSRQE